MREREREGGGRRSRRWKNETKTTDPHHRHLIKSSTHQPLVEARRAVVGVDKVALEVSYYNERVQRGREKPGVREKTEREKKDEHAAELSTMTPTLLRRPSLARARSLAFSVSPGSWEEREAETGTLVIQGETFDCSRGKRRE